MIRSLPEKTFEHWCSIHLNYRYRSHLQMWWPSSGPDIEAVAMPGSYGKRIWLELKTVAWNAAQSRHDLFIDAKQLDKYGRQAVPDYYVFPVPQWHGVLGDTSSTRWLAALPASQLAYQTRSKNRWFAEWTFVVPGHVLRRSLASEIATALARGTSMDIRIAEIKSSVLNWVQPGLSGISPILWKRFWEIMETCGSPEYPAQFIVPGGTGGLSSGGPIVPRSQLMNSLKLIAGGEFSADGALHSGFQLYEQSELDNYRLAETDRGGLADGFVWADADRALVLIEAGGLRL
jgi:hypothetical protein